MNGSSIYWSRLWQGKMVIKRLHSTTNANKQMRAWLVESFGAPLVKTNLPIPTLTANNQILIKVKASSLNPIDTRMAQGYGNEILSKWHQLELSEWNVLEAVRFNSINSRLPLITGRDCSGEVIEVGSKVTGFHPGDEVIAVIPAIWPGAHADYVIASTNGVALKPKLVGHTEACALCYTACTSWAALVDAAQINPNNATGKRVLIHGGSGGVGITAIQQLKAWGVEKIVATASAKNLDLIEKFGAIAIDYNSSTAKNQIIAAGPYEVILDCANSELSNWSNELLGIGRNCVYVSLVSPLLRDSDRYGLVTGLATTLIKYVVRSSKPALRGQCFKYAYFKPNVDCLTQLSQFIDEKKITPIIEKIYRFDEVSEAYAKVGAIHGRGKSVIDFSLN